MFFFCSGFLGAISLTVQFALWTYKWYNITWNRSRHINKIILHISAASPLFAEGVKKERKIRVNIIKEKGNYLKNTESRYVEGFFRGGGASSQKPPNRTPLYTEVGFKKILKPSWAMNGMIRSIYIVFVITNRAHLCNNTKPRSHITATPAQFKNWVRFVYPKLGLYRGRYVDINWGQFTDSTYTTRGRIFSRGRLPRNKINNCL